MNLRAKLLLLGVSFILVIGMLFSAILETDPRQISNLGIAARVQKPIMSAMTNATLKAELGRASWTLLHTIAGKFPLFPSETDKKLFVDYVHLFALVYPCGDCALHFQTVLRHLPVVASSRKETVLWACQAHNIVNKRLDKAQFDCKLAAEKWKCGCDEEEQKLENSGQDKKVLMG